MNERQRILLIATIAFVASLGTAIGLVYTKHNSRKLFVELEQANKLIVGLNNDWGRLQLEQSAWSDHGRIESVARTRLDMKIPDTGEIVFIRP